MTTGNRLKYLGVELLKKDATKSSGPVVGLFRGFRERSNGEGENAKVIKLMLIGTRDKINDLKALNMGIFNVLSLKMLYGDTKELDVFKSSDADQGKALELLEAALKEFQSENRMLDNDPEIVDISTFEEVPGEFFSPQKSAVSGAGVGAGAPISGVGYSGYQDSDWQQQQKKREEEKKLQEEMRWTPTPIKRKGDLPGLKALNAIKKKIAAIASGNYEAEMADPDPTDTFADGKKITTEEK